MSLSIRLISEVVSDASFVFALVPLFSQKRHFPFAVACVQLFSTVMYNLCDVLSSKLFLDKTQWHQVSDILTLTYILHTVVHLQQHDEETSAILRYTAFFLAWLFKLRDAWDSWVWEALLVVCYGASFLFSNA